jgi:dihydrofolate reductase
MSKIVSGLFLSLDGVAESPDRWVFPYMNDEVGKVVGANMEAAGSILLGRKLYQEWASYWPGKSDADDPYAGFINQIPKYVVSNTLRTVEWQNSTLVTGDVEGQIRALKEQDGKDIGMTGSMTLTGWLLRAKLLDELSLLVFPVLVGSGRRLFEDDGAKIPLTLAESHTFDNGVLSLRYVKE